MSKGRRPKRSDDWQDERSNQGNNPDSLDSLSGGNKEDNLEELRQKQRELLDEKHRSLMDENIDSQKRRKPGHDGL